MTEDDDLEATPEGLVAVARLADEDAGTRAPVDAGAAVARLAAVEEEAVEEGVEVADDVAAGRLLGSFDSAPECLCTLLKEDFASARRPTAS